MLRLTCFLLFLFIIFRNCLCLDLGIYYFVLTIV